MKYDFDRIIPREGTHCVKYDARKRVFKSSDVLPLWVADTDFATPDFIVHAIKKRAEHEILGYTFRPESYDDAVVGWMKRRHGWEIQSNWISFSPGVVAGITLAIETFSSPGDKVIVQPPVYFPFFESVRGSGRVLVENPLKLEGGRYTFDFDDLRLKIDDSTKLLILCNPHNPGGMVWTRQELEKLAAICLEHRVLVISDEIHSDLIFSGHTHIPFADLSEEAANNCVVCMAPSKTFNVAGLSSSLVIIPNESLMSRYEKKLQTAHLGMGNIFGSVALEAAYTYGDEWLGQLMDYLWGNYQYLETFFKNHLPEVHVMKPEATFLVWLDFSHYGMSGKDLFQFVVEEAGVGLNNGVMFGTGGEGWLRLNTGCPRSVLSQGLERLKDAFEKM